MTLPEQIKAALKKAHTSQAALSRHLGICHSIVHTTIHGYARNAKVEEAVEKLMGKKVFPPKKKPGAKRTTWPVAL